MNYCSCCKKIVNAISKSIPFSRTLDLVVYSCEECNNFLYQYLEDKEEE